jgi:hypothetical protein
VLAACLGRQAEGSPCRDRTNADGTDQILEIIDRIRVSVTAALREVRERAPGARVVMVGYPQLVPESGTCDILPLAAGDYAYVREMMVALGAATERAAADAGVLYADVLAASEGHDICAGDAAWVSGIVGDPDRPASPLHPFAEEQEAVADLVVDLVRDLVRDELGG